MPRLESGLATRTHGVHPSEKTSPHVISGFSPLGDPRCGWPPRGGAGSARPEGRHRAKPKIASYWPPAYRKRTGENAMPRLESGLATRTRGAHPSEKTTPDVISGFPPRWHTCWASPRGGAGSARPQRKMPA